MDIEVHILVLTARDTKIIEGKPPEKEIGTKRWGAGI